MFLAQGDPSGLPRRRRDLVEQKAGMIGRHQGKRVNFRSGFAMLFFLGGGGLKYQPDFGLQ